MRILWLCLLGVLAYLIGLAALFPAAPVADRIRPQLGPVVLEDVSGKLYSGSIRQVRYNDDLLPLQLSNAGWTVAPQTLLSGGAGVRFRFDGYGGQGNGLAMRRWNGDFKVYDFDFTASAKALEALLPVPVVSFSGELSGRVQELMLVDQLLSTFDGTLRWNNAQLQSPIPTALGQVDIRITPEGEASHTLTLAAQGGDVVVDGTITLTLSGDFSANVLLTPSQSAPAAVRNGLSQIARPDAQGRVRFVRQGNVNRLM